MNFFYKTAAVIGFGILETCVAMGLYVLPVRAETRIGGLISADAVWTREESPYLLTDSITVPDGIRLNVESGTTIGIAPEADVGDISYAPGIFVSGGHISILGSQQDRVTVKGVSGLFIAHSFAHNGSAHIAYTDFSGGSGISFENSLGTIASSTIKGAYMGITSKDSIVTIWGSRIQDNETGIYIEPHRIIVSLGTGGIGNALDAFTDLYASSSLEITGSVMTGNTTRAIFNNSDLTIQAQNNWWGSASGPSTNGVNSLQGSVVSDPWLLSEPSPESTVPNLACCSSILFIPGLQASRLYRPEPGLLGQRGTINQLWEPNRNADVSKLVLNSSGSSTDRTIYSGDPIDKALGVFDVYGTFMKFLDGLAARGTIGGWKAFGYDWRKPINEVVSGLEKRATTSEGLLQTVTDLASRSKTGKISIIAHSNGGLVAKYLVKSLADLGQAHLIDSVISVAVPYLGTPQAIAGLLHGDDQAILGGLILNKANARSLGVNMPSAYSLLPSRSFFTSVLGPTIAFASTTIPGINNGSYPTAAPFEAQQNFIADIANVRKVSPASNTKMPIKGNRLLMAAADAVHAILDPFQWPATITRWAIVGWNATTTKGVRYSDRGHTLVKNPYGDGTVKTQSAAYEGGQVVPIDLAAASRIENKDIEHSNILGASSTETVVGLIVSNPAQHTPKITDEISRIPAVSVGNKDWNALDAAYDASRKELRISTHSPVKLHVYDNAGNHTGEVALPAEISTQVEEGLYTVKEENVPGSSYEVLGCEGDLDCNTEITLPDEGRAYTIVIDGVGTGSFTLDIQRIRATSTIETVEWKNVPVTALTVATTTIRSSNTSQGSSALLASSTSSLIIDINGDGTSDATSSPNTSFEKHRILSLLKKFKWPKHAHSWFRKLTEADKVRITAEVAALIRKFER